MCLHACLSKRAGGLPKRSDMYTPRPGEEAEEGEGEEKEGEKRGEGGRMEEGTTYLSLARGAARPALSDQDASAR